jgi:hypothetical protein
MRVLVATQSASLASVLELAGHEVTEARPGDARQWTTGEVPPDHDAVVIDLADADLATGVAAVLRAAQQHSSIVVIQGASSGWDAAVLPPETTVLRPPLSRETLLASLTAQAQAASTAEPAHVAPPRPAPTTTSLPDLQQLAAAVDTLLTVEEVGNVVASDAADRLESAAIALLVPDGDSWRVVGSHGLRPAERRIVVSADHWLVAELVNRKRGAVIEHTDITRAQLRQAPLASLDHIVVATETELKALVMAGRDEDPFTEHDLAVLVSLLRAAGPSLKQALDLRDLARQLQPFAD